MGIKANQVSVWVIVAAMLVGAGASRADNVAPTGVVARVDRAFHSIEELSTLRQEAKKLGLRAWLFGGSAAAVVHHSRTNASTGDVQFADVFRWNQDVDIVVDAADPSMAPETVIERAGLLETAMLQAFPHLPGERARWEVRLLLHRRGDKAPLLGETYLWKQHNDTGSIGLVEVTDPTDGQSRFRDGSSWGSSNSTFLDDAARGRIRFLFAPNHDRTERSEEGLNPPLFAVVRFLTKKHQYSLETDDASRAHVRELAASASSQVKLGTFPRNAYVSKWLHHNVRKLLFNARDLPALWAELDELGLRETLGALGGDPTQVDTAAWWLAKDPLPHRPLGMNAPAGAPTAGSMGITRVTHFTKDIAAYEAIRRSTDFPNVFISRDGEKGERALYGDGFYVHPGEKEEAGGAFAVELMLDANAVAGIDFHIVPKTGAIVVLNRAALHMVPTPPGGDPVQFFRDLSGRGADAAANLGVLAQWRRRVASRFPIESKERRGEVVGMVDHALAGPLDASEHLLREWFMMPASTQHPETFRSLIARVKEPEAKWLLLQALQTPHWRRSSLGYDGVFALLGAPSDNFEGDRLDMALASTVLRPEDAWSTGWFEPAVFRLTMLHTAEHSLMGDVFLAPGFSGSPRAGRVMKTFVEYSFKRVDAARAIARSDAWAENPDALLLAAVFAKEPTELAPLFHSVPWRRTFEQQGANVQSLGRLRRWLLTYKEKKSRPTGLILPGYCSDELMEAGLVKQ